MVTLNTNKSCAATFNLNTAINAAMLTVVRSGNGTVDSNPSGIDCGSQCSQSYATGTTVKLAAKPGRGAKFAGWTGGGCQGVADCSVTLANSTSVNATFVPNPSKIGIFRPATGQWFLDANGNGIWEDCNVDRCLGPFGSSGQLGIKPGEMILPVVGDWTGSGFSNIGVYRPSTGEWFLDLNGKGQWGDRNVVHSIAFSLPIVGDWTGSGVEMIGEVIPGRTPKWYLDLNGDGITVNCNLDACFNFPSNSGDFPVAGDWNGTGTAKIGTFRPATGNWFLDLNGNGQWKNCRFDKCVNSFGTAGDRPVTGDWTGTGTTNIGVYRPATGAWLLDLNGNGKWDGCGTDKADKCIQIQFPDKNDGDLPVVGNW